MNPEFNRPAELILTRNSCENRFEVTIGGRLAKVDYRMSDNRMTITHTEVPDVLRGKGIAEQLVAFVWRYAREEGLAAVEHRVDALQVGDDDHLQLEALVFGERLEQLVLVAERLAAIDEVGCRVVGGEDCERAPFLYLVEVVADRRDGRQVRPAVNRVNSLKHGRRLVPLAGREVEYEKCQDEEKE